MELEPINDTPYEAAIIPFPSAGSTFHTIMVKAAFELTPGATAQKAQEQIPLTGADINNGEPQETAVHYESDFVPFKPQADAFCVGKAYAPEGSVTTETIIRFKVGPVNKIISVVGNRHWVKAFAGIGSKMTSPEPFSSIDVSYEHAYGGRDPGDPDGYRFYEFNPIGKGYTKNGKRLGGLPLPNLEDPRKPIKHWKDRVMPQSFGPIGRTWVPRIQRAGSYDKHWLENRSPELPEDFNEAYYNGAPIDQQILGYLHGNEKVQIDNMHPEHPHFSCRLPNVRVRSLLDWKTDQDQQLVEIPMNLDTLWVDMEALIVVLVWRGRILDSGLDTDTSLLIVEEPLNTTPPLPESYRPKLLSFEKEERDAESEFEEAENELAAMDGNSKTLSGDNQIESKLQGGAGV